jgi:hypothetical protein
MSLTLTISGKPDELLTTAETAAILGVKNNTAEIWRVRGIGPVFIKMGDGIRAPVRYRRSDVIAWIEKRLYASTSAYTAALAAMPAQRNHITEVLRKPPAPNAPWGKANA